MFTLLAHNWWAVLLRGIVAVLFGVLALIYPGLTVLVLAMLFGAYALVDGIFALVAGFSAPKGLKRWWILVLVGVVGILIGVITFMMPAATALALLYLIAAWAIITGILEIVAAIQLRKEITGEWLFILSGAISLIFGLLIALMPGAGALALVLWIGAFAIVYGVMLIVLSFRLRRWTRREAELHPA